MYGRVFDGAKRRGSLGLLDFDVVGPGHSANNDGENELVLRKISQILIYIYIHICRVR